MRRNRSHSNEYVTPTEPFTIEVRVGTLPANVWIGSSQVWQDLYETMTVGPGDQLHLLVGGDFLVRDGKAFAFDTRRHQAYEVMLHPAPDDPPLPTDKLRPLDPSEVKRPASYR